MTKLKRPTAKFNTAGDFRPGGNARTSLYGIVERLERLDEERKGISNDMKEVYGEAKGMGFDTGIIRKVIQRRKLDSATLGEVDALIDLYETTINQAEKTAHDASVESGA